MPVVAEHISAFFLVLRDAAGVIELLSWLARDVGAHVPRICVVEERLLRDLGDLLAPLIFAFLRRFEVGDVFAAELGDRVDDPVALAFDTRWAVGESRWALSAVYWSKQLATTSDVQEEDITYRRTCSGTRCKSYPSTTRYPSSTSRRGVRRRHPSDPCSSYLQ